MTLSAAATLTGCGTAPRPFSIEEAVWFHRASDYDIPPGYPLPLYAPPPAYQPPPFEPPPPGYN